MERFLAFPQFPVCTCRKWHQELGSLIFVEPEALKAVNYFLSAGESCPFSLHESAADSQLLHGTAVYPIYKKGSVDVLSSCLWSPEHNKILLVSSDPPSQRSRTLCQRKMRVSQMSARGKGSADPSLSSAAASQTLGWSQGHEAALGWWRVLWFGFHFCPFSLSKTILPFYRVQSGTE